MPRIDFQPPLATTTTVHLPPTSVFNSAKDPHVTLSFIARPIDGLAEDDIVEIWTDGGTSRSWRAIPFERDGEDRDLVARISVDMVKGSFGFTYRVTHASGDATWLGDMGGNGKIDLIPSEGEDALWKGEDWLRFVDGWTGFGVHVDEASVPSLVLYALLTFPQWSRYWNQARGISQLVIRLPAPFRLDRAFRNVPPHGLRYN